MAKQQVWWLARDGGADGLVVCSRYPLHNHDTGGTVNWMPKDPYGEQFEAISYETYCILTGGKYELMPGAMPRKIVFTPLGVTEVKS